MLHITHSIPIILHVLILLCVLIGEISHFFSRTLRNEILVQLLYYNTTIRLLEESSKGCIIIIINKIIILL